MSVVGGVALCILLWGVLAFASGALVAEWWRGR